MILLLAKKSFVQTLPFRRSHMNTSIFGGANPFQSRAEVFRGGDAV